MNALEVSFNFKARYFKLGEITAATKQVWFVIHGYGQPAKYFLKKFNILEQHNICVIAPEGLSRFYLQDVKSRVQTGDSRVGATWMTKENRLMDIENYIAYLNSVYQKEIGKTSTPVTILGFSQGAATASRWVADGTIDFDRFILWAGILPPDMDFEAGKEILKNKQTFLIYGDQDPFLNDDRFAEMNTLAKKLNISPQSIVFNGGHDIDQETLLKFI